MASISIEHIATPSTERAARRQAAAAQRADDELAGRTLWCAAGLPATRAPAQALRHFLELAGPGAPASLDVAGDEPLRGVAERLAEMLEGRGRPAAALGPADAALLAAGAEAAEQLLGASVGSDDVVVAHDPLTALLSQAVRERGAHAVWHVRPHSPTATPAIRHAQAFLAHYTQGVDAYVVSWTGTDGWGGTVEHVVAVMPSPAEVAMRDVPLRAGAPAQRQDAWRRALADVVHNDRDERVGGTRHARPSVAVR